MISIRFIDLFAGIGGFRLAFESVGARCVFSSEINPSARKTYRENFGDEPAGDIRDIEASIIPSFDVLCAGFPCQPFSSAGVSKKQSMGRPHGFADKTSGTLFFEILRILEWHQPSAFLLENVKNLQAHDRGRTFTVIQKSLEALGYKLFVQLIDGRFWVPQKRQRIYIAGFRDRAAWAAFVRLFEDAISGSLFDESPLPKLADILDVDVPARYTLGDKTWSYLQGHAEKHSQKGNGFGVKGFADLDGCANTLSARYGKDGAEILIEQIGRNPRRLTPRECARLMGYPDDFVFPVSDSQAYKQLGNSVIPPVIRILAGAMVPSIDRGAVIGKESCVSL